MRERPILFSGPMVRALLDGRKTQTRRVVKPNPEWASRLPICDPSVMAADHQVWFWDGEHERAGASLDCPYGVPGDRLWVKETWRPTTALDPCGINITYAADGALRTIKDGEFGERDWTMPKAAATGNVSPLFMPRWASRLTLTITEVRAQRLQDISEADAIAEGATPRPVEGAAEERWCMDWSRVGSPRFGTASLTPRDIGLSDPQMAFANYINQLHGGPRWNFYYNDATRYPQPIWDANPWVWAMTFQVEERQP